MQPQVTILFADIVGFTTMCSTVPAEVVVGTLHRLFSAFDEETGPFGVYKVDTVGARIDRLRSTSEASVLLLRLLRRALLPWVGPVALSHRGTVQRYKLPLILNIAPLPSRFGPTLVPPWPHCGPTPVPLRSHSLAFRGCVHLLHRLRSHGDGAARDARYPDAALRGDDAAHHGGHKRGGLAEAAPDPHWHPHRRVASPRMAS